MAQVKDNYNLLLIYLALAVTTQHGSITTALTRLRLNWNLEYESAHLLFSQVYSTLEATVECSFASASCKNLSFHHIFSSI